MVFVYMGVFSECSIIIHYNSVQKYMVQIFKNIGIGDLLTAIRRCSSLLRCCRCSMSDVYIGRTLISGAIKSCIYTVLYHSVSECESDESVEFAIFFAKLVAMATSLDISEKEVQIDHLHPNGFYSVKTLRKSVQQILR